MQRILILLVLMIPSFVSPGPLTSLAEAIRSDSGNQHVVFVNFPDDRRFFHFEVRLIVDSAIYRYVCDEWKANIMTDEFHGHLGEFPITIEEI